VKHGHRILLALVSTGLLGAAQQTTPPYKDPTLPIPQRVQDLLARMTLQEKIGQMTQAERGAIKNPDDVRTLGLGSILSGGGSNPRENTPAGWADMITGFQRAALGSRLGIPMLYGVDAVHGHNNVHGAVIFPHNIGLGATRNPTLAQRIGRATALEVAATGVHWTFSPCVCVVRDPRWGRTYESFGETPDIATSMATIIDGYQGTPGQPGSVLATAKHYLGDGGTAFGSSKTEAYLLDQGDARLTEAELRAVHLPPFKAAVQRGVATIMASFSSWNGTKLHGHKYLLTDVLKGELGFQGFVVSDWQGIDQIHPDYATSVRTAINAGIDMVMVPNEYRRFIDTLTAEVQAGRVPMSRIDDAVSRILTQKLRFGLFERPLPDATVRGTFGTQAHRDLARQAVRESLVLLKNDGVLPLKAGTKRLLVAGSNADDLGNQLGGWSLTWQGQSGTPTKGTTILQGIRQLAGSTKVDYVRTPTREQARTYDAAVIVVGERPYAEGKGDTNTLNLRADDREAIDAACAATKCIVVVVSGRPMNVADRLPRMHALVAAWLPGTEGAGVADVLFGKANFTGKLPITWPKSDAVLPVHGKPGAALFPYGFGLAYASKP